MRRTLVCALGVGMVALVAVAGGAQEAREALVAQGREIFRAGGCLDCHTVGAVGTPIAPDLSRVGNRYREGDLARWLVDPRLQPPTFHMPPFQLTEAEVRALAAYLVSLR